jgi:hypothetical protein
MQRIYMNEECQFSITGYYFDISYTCERIFDGEIGLYYEVCHQVVDRYVSGPEHAC